jgi:glycosyltransferase involved in cell wall biosynthesis
MTLQTNKKRIALITTWYPPINGVAVSRMNAFANYLSEEFDVEVFCLGEKENKVKKSSNLLIHYCTSNKLFAKLKASQSDSKIKHRAKTGLRILLKYVVKNPLSSWRNSTNQKLKDQHLNNSFDLIISSFAPKDAHLVAINFCKEFKNVPWIADMRDEMSSNPYIDLQTKNELIEIEKEVNKYASAITSVSQPIVKEFESICSSVLFFEEIRNGFDHNLIFSRNNLESDEFKLGYFGSFYGERKPDYVFNSLVEIRQEYPLLKFSIHIYGAHNNFSIPALLKDVVFRYPSLGYIDAINEMNKMDGNILIHPRTAHKGVYSGKIFDYISAEKPILAFVDKDDVAANLINKLDCGYVAEFADQNENKCILLEAFKNKIDGVLKSANKDDIKTFHRKNQITELINLINKLTVK